MRTKFKISETIDGVTWTATAVLVGMVEDMPLIELRDVRGTSDVTGAPVWLTPETEVDLTFAGAQAAFVYFRIRAP